MIKQICNSLYFIMQTIQSVYELYMDILSLNYTDCFCVWVCCVYPAQNHSYLYMDVEAVIANPMLQWKQLILSMTRLNELIK